MDIPRSEAGLKLFLVVLERLPCAPSRGFAPQMCGLVGVLGRHDAAMWLRALGSLVRLPTSS